MKKKIDTTVIILALILYWGFCAGLWHFAFWSTFNINFLQYIDLEDVIKDFSLPFFNLFGVYLLTVSGAFMIFYFEMKAKDSKGFQGTMKKWLSNKIISSLLLFYFGSIIIVAAYPAGWKYNFIMFLYVIPISFLITIKSEFLQAFIPYFNLRMLFINFVIGTPVSAFCHGKIRSLEIYENRNYELVTHIELIDDSAGVNNYNGLKIIGNSDERVFLTHFDNKEIIILNYNQIRDIRYKNYSYYSSTPDYYSNIK